MKMIASTAAWIAQPKPNASAAIRLFCIPHAGGGASMFYPWLSQLPSEVELCLIQLPGRENRLWEQPLTDLLSLVRVLLPLLHPYLGIPFALFGHSMGALIAFELARQLQQRGAAPSHLFVAGREAPQLPNLASPLHSLPEAEFIQEICRRYNGIPETLLETPELMRLLLPTLRADVTIVETYRYSEGLPLICPITIFGGLEDLQINREVLSAWRQQTRQSFRLHMLPGDHFFLNNNRKPFLHVLHQELSHLLGQLTDDAPSQQSQFSYIH